MNEDSNGREEEQVVRRSSRRAIANQSSSSKKSSALDELKRARQQKGRYRQRVDDLIEDVWEEVDEDDYRAKKSVRDFVENDDGDAYHTDSEESDEEKAKKVVKEKERKSKPKKGTLFEHMHPIGKMKAKDERSVRIDEDDDLKEIMGMAGLYDEPLQDEGGQSDNLLCRMFNVSSSSSSFANNKIDAAKPFLKRDASTFFPLDSPPPSKQICHVEECAMDLDSIMEDEISPIIEKEIPPIIEKEIPPIIEKEISPIIENEEVASNMVGEFLPIIEEEIDLEQFDKGDFVQFYFLDAFEDPFKRIGVVYLFGHAKAPKAVSYCPCCIVLKKIDRQIYFVKGDETTTQEDLKDEAEIFLFQKGIKECKRKIVTKNVVCAPSIEEKGGSKKNLEMLEVWLKTIPPGVDSDTTGKTFSHILNTTATPLERFLLERDIRGPCWLEIYNANLVFQNARISHCPLEYSIDMDKGRKMANVSMMVNCQDPPPPINVMSLNVITAQSKGSREQQIVMVSATCHKRCVLENPFFYDASNNPLREVNQICVFTKLKNGTALPFNMKLPPEAKSVANEKSLLILFLAELKKFDPDIITSHDLSLKLSLLASRIETYKMGREVGLGRLKRIVKTDTSSLKPTIGGFKSAKWELASGRLCLDVKTTAMELIHLRSFDMAELVATQLPDEKQRVQLNAGDIAQCIESGSAQTFLKLIDWNWNETRLVLKLVQRLDIIPLFVQLTRIVGGVLSRTLLGGRAERNEYLLLHACHNAGYVPPDKHYGKTKKVAEKTTKKKKSGSIKKTQTQNTIVNDENDDETMQVDIINGAEEEAEDDEEDQENQVPNANSTHPTAETQQKKKGNKKAQYTGGLVLEPMKGLYETFIVLLDFNSLYPSIIREFNICFTTIESAFDELPETELPLPPGSSYPDGILKTEIHKLVESRRDVKELMKKLEKQQVTSKQQHEKKKQLEIRQCEIRQKGLKLTANSLYGCLGFASCRFYAPTLASMITFKGRELLLQAKSTVEKEGFTVVYGDTDSLMIDTCKNDFDSAKEVGERLKTALNKNYIHLKLDIDGIYKRMLLLKKKKYAGLLVDANGKNEKVEMKGLDIVRRDWSELAKDIGEEVVRLILSKDLDRDTLAEYILKLLAESRLSLDRGEVSVKKFEILKQLTQNPNEYKEKAQPHVQVARRLNEKKMAIFRQGDVVPYIICHDGSNNGAMQRAYHRLEYDAKPEELSITTENEEKPKKLTIDIDYYLTEQILPVVSRLCEPFDELDEAKIAEAIGIDGSKYRRRHHNVVSLTSDAVEDWENMPGAVGFPQDFSVCEGFSFECCSCKKLNVIRSLAAERGKDFRLALETCSECGVAIAPTQHASVLRHLNLAIGAHIKRYLQSPFLCDDVACAAEFYVPMPQFISGQSLICYKCLNGVPKRAYSCRRLFDQQCFLRTLFDLTPLFDKNIGNKKFRRLFTAEELACLRERLGQNIEQSPAGALYAACLALVNTALDCNAFNRVDLSVIFKPFLCEKKMAISVK